MRWCAWRDRCQAAAAAARVRSAARAPTSAPRGGCSRARPVQGLREPGRCGHAAIVAAPSCPPIDDARGECPGARVTRGYDSGDIYAAFEIHTVPALQILADGPARTYKCYFVPIYQPSPNRHSGRAALTLFFVAREWLVPRKLRCCCVHMQCLIFSRLNRACYKVLSLRQASTASGASAAAAANGGSAASTTSCGSLPMRHTSLSSMALAHASPVSSAPSLPRPAR